MGWGTHGVRFKEAGPRPICRMKKNRKRQPLQFGMVLKTVVACVTVAILGLAYVWQKNQIYRLGDEIKKREAAAASAQKRNVMLAAQLANLKSPDQLEARCQQYKLELTSPKENQIVRLIEPGAEWDTRLVSLSPTTAQPRDSKPKPRVMAKR
jgi:cell division protein FtsB